MYNVCRTAHWYRSLQYITVHVRVYNYSSCCCDRLNEYQTGGAPPNAVARPSSTSPSSHPQRHPHQQQQQQQQQHRRSGSIDRPSPSPQPAAYHQQAATEPAFTTTVTAPHSFSVPSTVTVTRRASGPPPAPLYPRTQPALIPATTAVGMIPSVSEVSLTNAAPPVMNQLPPGGQMPSVRPYPPPHPRGPDSVTPIGDPTAAMARPMMLPPPASRGGYPPPPHYAGGPYGPVRPRPPPPGGYPPRMPYRHRSDPAIMRHPLPPPRFMVSSNWSVFILVLSAGFFLSVFHVFLCLFRDHLHKGMDQVLFPFQSIILVPFQTKLLRIPFRLQAVLVIMVIRTHNKRKILRLRTCVLYYFCFVSAESQE